MKTVITKENESEILSKYKQELFDRRAKLVYNFYVDGQFVTDCYWKDYDATKLAYERLGNITVEVELVCDDCE